MAERRRAAADDRHAAERPEVQRELIERLADHEIAGLGFGTGFAHKRLPAALVTAARKRGFPLFEVPTSCRSSRSPSARSRSCWTSATRCCSATWSATCSREALTGHLYPEDLQARLRPFGIGEQVAVLAFRLPDPSAAAALVERILERERVAAWWRSARACCAR